jgi:formylglycine-generating enzyme required for sulfatase activity
VTRLVLAAAIPALAAPPPAAPPGMRWIPPGEFTMGTDSSSSHPNERPAHRVRLAGFWIGETTVTNAIQGGSFLCNVSCCESYRPSARRGTPPDPGSEHIGFRCVKPGSS